MFDAVFLGGLNHLLESANWARARLAPFAGRRARFAMPPFEFGFEVSSAGMVVANPDPGLTDVVIRLPADTPFLLPQGLDRVMAQATVEGNAEFATELSFVFRNLRWDAEEDLSKLVGDIAAHRIVQGASRFVQWQKQAATHLAQNFGEYLTLENPMLIRREEFLSLRDHISQLNADLARVEKRLAALI
ncbi:MAG: SCP2 sterol-binding domain-containing protein [Pseudomonadota bacterium]